MLDSFKSFLNNTLFKAKDSISLDAIQNALQGKLHATIENAFLERKNDSVNSHFGPMDEEKILKEYLIKNIGLATAMSFVPGPAGILTAVPTMISSISNQMKSTYDIACAYDKEDLVIKDLLIDIPLQALGVPTGLADIQNAKTLDPSDLDDKIIGFGKVYAKKKLKSALTKTLPGLSTAFAIAEAKIETQNTIKTASSFFDPAKTIVDPFIPDQSKESIANEERIKLLINLITIDSSASKGELEFILPVIKKSELSPSKRRIYQNALQPSPSNFEVSYDTIIDAGINEGTILDMVVLTKRDDHIGPKEVGYVKETAKKLKIDESLYKSLIE